MPKVVPAPSTQRTNVDQVDCSGTLEWSLSHHLFVVYGRVDVPNLVFDLKWTPIFEWCMVGCESKNGHQQDMY